MKIAAGAVALVLVLAGCSSGRDDEGSGDTNISLRVESDGDTADITFGVLGQSSQANGASVPWIRTAPISAAAAKQADQFTIVAQADDGASYITCTILVGTKEIASNRSTGAYSVVTC